MFFPYAAQGDCTTKNSMNKSFLISCFVAVLFCVGIVVLGKLFKQEWPIAVAFFTIVWACIVRDPELSDPKGAQWPRKHHDSLVLDLGRFDFDAWRSLGVGMQIKPT